METRTEHKRFLDMIVGNLIQERVFARMKSTQDNKVEEELISLSNAIREIMGPNQNLFMRYDELSTLIENDSLRDVYKQGLKDGIQLIMDILLEGKTSSRFP